MDTQKRLMINDMLCIIRDASIPDNVKYIFEAYLKRKDKNIIKPIFNMFADTFITLHSYCLLMQNFAWSQAGTLLRIAIEQVSTLFVLTWNKESVDEFLRIDSLKKRFYSLEGDKEAQKQFIKENNIPLFHGKPTKYFDYGWVSIISPDHIYSRDHIIKASRLEEFLNDVDVVFNKFSHGKLTIFDFAGSDGSWKVMKDYGARANMTCGKLFDFLCCSYDKWVSRDDFDKMTEGLFEEFKMIYSSLLSAGKKKYK